MSSKIEKRSKPTNAKTADKEFKCIYSGCNSIGFNTFSAKQRHERELHGNVLKCRQCDFTAKRRYQMTTHVEIDHPKQRANAFDDTWMEQASHGSTGSCSSEDSTYRTLQHPPTGNQAFSDSTALFDQLPTYSSSAYYDSENRNSSSSPDSQAQLQADQPSYMTTIRSNPLALSPGSGTPWGAPILASRPAPDPLSFGTSLPMNPPNQFVNPFPQRPSYQARIDRNITCYKSPYPSPSSEQETVSRPSANSPYIGETGQSNNWPEQSPAKSQ